MKRFLTLKMLSEVAFLVLFAAIVYIVIYFVGAFILGNLDQAVESNLIQLNVVATAISSAIFGYVFNDILRRTGQSTVRTKKNKK